MIVSLIILGALLLTGAILYLLHRRNPGEPADVADTAAPAQGECCGRHATCERDSLLASVSDGIEYFDDVELDAFRGRTPDSYTPAETEMFRDVLLTLRPDDIAPWARSIQLRSIELPAAVRDELLLLVAEARRGRGADI